MYTDLASSQDGSLFKTIYAGLSCAGSSSGNSSGSLTTTSTTPAAPETIAQGNTVTPPVKERILGSQPLRPLTSLNWPYVPEEPAYPDPLKRDDPKPLQLSDYEAIATSATIREILVAHPRLTDSLISIDKLQGPRREDALQRALGINIEHLRDPSDAKISPELDEDVIAFRKLAEAIEMEVRGGKEGGLGFDWGE